MRSLNIFPKSFCELIPKWLATNQSLKVNIIYKTEIYGMGPFLCIVVNASNPIFEGRKTIVNGTKKVCTNIFNKKYYYRDLVKNFTVHSTDDAEETNRNLTLLIGKSLADFNKEHAVGWDGTIKNYNSNLIGADGWENTDEILYVLKSYYSNAHLGGKKPTCIHFSSEYPDEVERCVKHILNSENLLGTENQFTIKIKDKIVNCEFKKNGKRKFYLVIKQSASYDQTTNAQAQDL